MKEIPRLKVLSEKKIGSKIVSVRRKYLSDLNQICHLDSNYEYNYALYLDFLYSTKKIVGWVRNTTLFGFSKPVEVGIGRMKPINSHRPDFIIFANDAKYEIHEVKGWMNEKATKVDEQFRKDYPNLVYKVIGKNDMLSLQSEYKNKLWGWVEVR